MTAEVVNLKTKAEQDRERALDAIIGALQRMEERCARIEALVPAVVRELIAEELERRDIPPRPTLVR